MADVLMNRPPAITWHRLKANGTAVELPGIVPFDRADMAGWLAANAGEPWDVVLSGDSAVSWIDVGAQCRGLTVHTVDVVAGEGVRGCVTIHVDGEQPGEDLADAGTVGLRVCVRAAAGAQVQLDLLQTLDAGFTYVEDVALELAAGARVEVRQTELGASRAFVGCETALAGDGAQADIDVRYLGRGDAQLDFNYVLDQSGRETATNLVANGILADEARKTFRDTINMHHGCKGSSGAETETVLLLGDGVSNISLPVILCDEDDVAGEHGATIGHVNTEQLEYLMSRGLDEAQIEALFFGAVYDLAVSRARTERARAAIARLRGVQGGAAGDAEEE